MEFGLLAVVVVAMATAWVVLRGTDARQWFDAVLTATVVGLFVGRVTAMVLAGTNPVLRPLDVLIVRGGVDTAGATLGALGFLAWVVRRDPWRALDAIAPAAAAALAAWQAGCVVAGSCLGTPSGLPWAASTAGGVARHPTEIYAAVALALISAGLIVLRTRVTARPGVLAGGALLSVSAVRLATEPLRVTIGSGPDAWYAAGIAAGAALLAWRIAATRPRAG